MAFDPPFLPQSPTVRLILAFLVIVVFGGYIGELVHPAVGATFIIGASTGFVVWSANNKIKRLGKRMKEIQEQTCKFLVTSKAMAVNAVSSQWRIQTSGEGIIKDGIDLVCFILAFCGIVLFLCQVQSNNIGMTMNAIFLIGLIVFLTLLAFICVKSRKKNKFIATMKKDNQDLKEERDNYKSQSEGKQATIENLEQQLRNQNDEHRTQLEAATEARDDYKSFSDDLLTDYSVVVPVAKRFNDKTNTLFKQQLNTEEILTQGEANTEFQHNLGAGIYERYPSLQEGRPFNPVRQRDDNRLNSRHLVNNLATAEDTHPDRGIHKDLVPGVRVGTKGQNDDRVKTAHGVRKRNIEGCVNSAAKRVCIRMEQDKLKVSAAEYDQAQRVVEQAKAKTIQDLQNSEYTANSVHGTVNMVKNGRTIENHLKTKKDLVQRYQELNVKYQLPSVNL
ncbi:MAG: hypothetical protein SGILL_003235 [Bacillariaceae sp.]